MKRLYFILICFSLSSFAFSQKLASEKTAEGTWVLEGDEKVLFYQASTKAKDGKYARANYIHPLFNVDGYELTEDFPRDHLHHRGVFWTWHQVLIGDQSMGDAWECKDFVWDVIEYGQGDINDESITIKAKVHWKSPKWKDANGGMKPFVEERTTVKVHRKSGVYRVIDFEISLLALEPELRIGGSDDHKGYGGFSARVKMPKDILFSSKNGRVEPKTEQVEAGPWMNIFGSMAADGENGGVIIMNHPENPMYPEKWILRKKGSMQNPVFPGRAPRPISTRSPTILKYRLVVYAGELTDREIEKMYLRYK